MRYLKPILQLGGKVFLRLAPHNTSFPLHFIIIVITQFLLASYRLWENKVKTFLTHKRETSNEHSSIPQIGVCEAILSCEGYKKILLLPFFSPNLIIRWFSLTFAAKEHKVNFVRDETILLKKGIRKNRIILCGHYYRVLFYQITRKMGKRLLK